MKSNATCMTETQSAARSANGCWWSWMLAAFGLLTNAMRSIEQLVPNYDTFLWLWQQRLAGFRGTVTVSNYFSTTGAVKKLKILSVHSNSNSGPTLQLQVYSTTQNLTHSHCVSDSQLLLPLCNKYCKGNNNEWYITSIWKSFVDSFAK